MSSYWTFDWQGLWQRSDFDCQSIIKLVYADQVFGLIRYGLYFYPGTPQFLEIEQIEASPNSRGKNGNRIIYPIGKWLIWYAIQVGLQNCTGLSDGTLILLTAKDSEELIEYYRDIIQLEYREPTTIASGEEGHVFTFSRAGAEAFCQRQEENWGVPRLY